MTTKNDEGPASPKAGLDRPRVGWWYFQMYGFVPMGCYRTKEDAIAAGRERAARNGFSIQAVGRWKNKVVAGDWEELVRQEEVER